MTEQDIRDTLNKGFEKIKPNIGQMTNLMMDCYSQGFRDCWKLLTGKEF